MQFANSRTGLPFDTPFGFPGAFLSTVFSDCKVSGDSVKKGVTPMLGILIAGNDNGSDGGGKSNSYPLLGFETVIVLSFLGFLLPIPIISFTDITRRLKADVHLESQKERGGGGSGERGHNAFDREEWEDTDEFETSDDGASWWDDKEGGDVDEGNEHPEETESKYSDETDDRD
jgi:hypothetical protein